jgi:hypothetical protein
LEELRLLSAGVPWQTPVVLRVKNERANRPASESPALLSTARRGVNAELAARGFRPARPGKSVDNISGDGIEFAPARLT